MGAKRLRRFGNAPVLTLSLVLGLAALSGVDGQSRADPPSSVPKARCGPGDRTESGLQGQTTAAERFSAVGSKQAFNCNLELVGAARGEGANWDMAVFDSCVYVGTANGPQQRQPGTMVVDVSNPRDPRVTAHLDSRTMTEPNETLAVPHPVSWTHVCATRHGVARIPRALRAACDTPASRGASTGCSVRRTRRRRRAPRRGFERPGRRWLAP